MKWVTEKQHQMLDWNTICARMGEMQTKHIINKTVKEASNSNFSRLKTKDRVT
ncbi:hypothetical protein HanRHA438_Chr08g0353901 [Helianthus annuus]|nr:hypothetical protein HanRHA438_Chr08g0353901 [Helianthus annuus]